MHASELKLVSSDPLTPARQGAAIVVERDAAQLVLVEAQRRFTARRASSCLLEPALGDRVWFVSEPGLVGEQRSYVIAVLEREAAGPARLSVEGEVELRADQLTIVGEQGLALRSPARVDVEGDELRVRGRLARVLLDECSMVLRSLFAHVGKSTFVAKLIETLAERISVHSQTSLRTTEQLDQVKAGAIEVRAESSAQIGAAQTFVTGAELVKVEGAQIHLG
jgi:hypothetical protein